MQLAKSNVVFNAQDHTYYLGDKQLKGVTGILERRLFPEKYANIPKHILEQAAQRGSYVHEMCDMVDTLDATPEDCVEALNYKEMKKRLNLVSVESEYLVSDEEHYASSIDVVYEAEGGVILNDRKTTSKLDMESLSWQLSIYKLFFEKQNPDIKVVGLTATWLRGDICEYVEVEAKPEELVVSLLEADINDEPFEYDAEVGVPDFIMDKLSTMAFLNRRIKALQAELDEIKVGIESEMVKEGLGSVKTPVATFSYTQEKTSKSFDSKAFLLEHPEWESKYQKETKKKGYLTIKFK